MFPCDWLKIWEAGAPMVPQNLHTILQINLQNSLNGLGLIQMDSQSKGGRQRFDMMRLCSLIAQTSAQDLNR